LNTIDHQHSEIIHLAIAWYVEYQRHFTEVADGFPRGVRYCNYWFQTPERPARPKRNNRKLNQQNKTDGGV